MISAGLMIAILLLLLLLLLAVKSALAGRDVSSGPNAALLGDVPELTLCPPEFASRIFSNNDFEFVVATKSSGLRRLFERERKDVALLWVRQTSAAIRHIMCEHAVVARENRELEFATELRLLALYVQLMVVCGILFVVIQSTSPLWLRGLAMYADSLSRRIAWAQKVFESTPVSREVHGMGQL